MTAPRHAVPGERGAGERGAGPGPGARPAAGTGTRAAREAGPRTRGTRRGSKLPPHVYFLVSAVFHYLGPALAVLLFGQIAPLGVAWLRIASAAAVFALWRRPGRLWRIWRASPARGRRLLVLFGFVLAAMNACFYLAIARIPLATVGAMEFLGPVLLAALGTRTRRNAAALVLAVTGVALLSEVRITGDAAGLAFSETPSVSAIARTTAAASPTGMATGTAMRAMPFRFLRRRHADRLPETMRFTSYVRSCSRAETLEQVPPASPAFPVNKSLRLRNDVERYLNKIFHSANVAGRGVDIFSSYRAVIAGYRNSYDDINSQVNVRAGH